MSMTGSDAPSNLLPDLSLSVGCVDPESRTCCRVVRPWLVIAVGHPDKQPMNKATDR